MSYLNQIVPSSSAFVLVKVDFKQKIASKIQKNSTREVRIRIIVHEYVIWNY